jgi:hypothetical protein
LIAPDFEPAVGTAAEPRLDALGWQPTELLLPFQYTLAEILVMRPLLASRLIEAMAAAEPSGKDIFEHANVASRVINVIFYHVTLFVLHVRH